MLKSDLSSNQIYDWISSKDEARFSGMQFLFVAISFNPIRDNKRENKLQLACSIIAF